MPKAELLVAVKNILEDGSLVQIKLWKLPEVSNERPHGLKYSLAYIVNRVRVVGYDNERGKGDHRHWNDEEYPYTFVDMTRLMNDFYDDVEQWRTEQ